MGAGREREVAAAVAAVQAGRGAVLAGPRGAGRTTVLDACRALVGGDVEVVDDLHLLDPTAAGALRERVATGQVRVLGTVVAGAPCPAPVQRLWRDDGVSRIDLAPLPSDLVADLAADRAGAPVEAVTVRRLVELSGGWPGDLTELLGALVANNWFDGGDGIARLRPGLPDAPALRDRLADLDRLSPAGRLAVELVAVGRAVPLAAVTRVATTAGLDEARAAGLVDVDGADPARPCRPVSPLTGELVRMALGAERERDHRAALAKALGAGAVGWEARRLVAEAAADDRFADPARLPLARSVVAEALVDGSDVVALAEALWQATGDAGDGLNLTLALDHAGQPVEQATVARALLALDGGDDRVIAVAGDRLASSLARLGRPEEAILVLLDARRRVRDPMALARLTIGLAGRHLHNGELGAAIEICEPFLELGVPVPEAALVAAVAHAAAGRCDRALELAAVGETMVGAEEAGELVGTLLVVARALAHTGAGRLDDAEAAVLGAYDDAVAAGDRPKQGWSALSLGRIELARGRAQRALRYFGDAAVGYGAMGEVRYVAWALAGRAAALALCGDLEGAEAVAAARGRLPGPLLGLFEPESQRLLALVETRCGATDASRARLEAAVASAGEQALARAECLHDLGDHSALADLAAEGDDRVVALAAHAAALRAGDAAALAGAAGRFERHGAWLDAATAWAEAAAHSSDRRNEAGGRRRAWAMAARCEGTVVPAVAALATIRLSERQLDVATLAGAGLSRPAIAAQLFLSDRTVDRHLGDVFAALGVREHRELRAALDDVRRAQPADPADPGERDWPLVGRADEADAVRRALADPSVRGVVLTGPVGCGTTRLATEIQAELARRKWMPVTVRGTAPAEATIAALDDALATDRVALLVDDVGALDDATLAAVVTALGSLRGAALLTTSDAGLPARLDRPDVRVIAVGPLAPAAMRELVTADLGAMVSATTAATFEQASAGNPLVLRELLRGARASGRLVERQAVWALAGPLVPGPALRDLVGQHLAALDSATRAAVDLVAAAGSLPRAIADLVLDPSGLRSAVAEGLLVDDGAEVHLSHESYEAEALARLALDARAAHVESVLTAVDAASAEVDPVRLARWSLDAGRAPSSDLLANAAAHALRRGDASFALDLAGLAGERGRLVGAVARSVLGDHDAADAELTAIGGDEAATLRADLARWRFGSDEPTPEPSELGADTVRWHAARTAVAERVAGLTAEGRLDEAELAVQAMARGAVAHPMPEEGLLALERGHVSRAVVLLRDALEDPMVQPGTVAWSSIRLGLAYAAALAGDAATARRELGLAGPVSAARAEAWVLAAEGDRPAAATALLAAGGDPVLVHDAVRLGDFTAAPRLAELAARGEGPLAAARCLHARGVVDRDPAVLLDAADAFDACGTDLLAGEVAQLAATWLDEQGDQRASRRAATRARELLARCDGVAALLPARPAALTPRQLDIARLAAQGLASRAIAERLGLSVRTVDNQLQRVYERLAIRGRHALAAALSSE